MNKVLFILFFCSFCVFAKGQSTFYIKDSLLYTHIVLYTDKALGIPTMIDTGCSLCVIDSTFADSLGIIINENKASVNDRKEGLSTCIIDSIEFCEKKYQKVPCLVADLKNIYQKYAPNFIIGGDVLRDRPLKFDRSSMTIEPTHGEHQKGGIAMKWKNYKSDPTIPVLYIMFEAKMNGQKYNFVFDTGSIGNKLPYNIQLEPSDTIQRESADINNELSIKQQKIYKNVYMQIANQTFKFDFLEGKKKWGVLGLDLVKEHSFVLNYKDRTLEIIL